MILVKLREILRTKTVLDGSETYGGQDDIGDFQTIGLSIGNLPVLHIIDLKTSGTHGGTFDAGGPKTRTLNTILTNTITGASLLNDVITLPAGTYFVDGSAPAYQVDGHQAKLFDNTSTFNLARGTTEKTTPVTGSQTHSRFRQRFVLSVSSNITVEHECKTTVVNSGFGFAVSLLLGGPEIYTEVIITKTGV